MSYNMQKVQQLGNIIWGILGYAPALAWAYAIQWCFDTSRIPAKLFDKL